MCINISLKLAYEHLKDTKKISSDPHSSFFTNTSLRSHNWHMIVYQLCSGQHSHLPYSREAPGSIKTALRSRGCSTASNAQMHSRSPIKQFCHCLARHACCRKIRLQPIKLATRRTRRIKLANFQENESTGFGSEYTGNHFDFFLYIYIYIYIYI